MASNVPVCLSSSAGPCTYLKAPFGTAFGYYCKQDKCLKCPMGTRGRDGRICDQCPFATWTATTGQSNCTRLFTYSSPGQQKSYIPFGVTNIVVKIWGGGGGGDNSSDPNFVPHSGGGGGFSSCNLTVTHSRSFFVIVGGGGGSYSLSSNAGGVF